MPGAQVIGVDLGGTAIKLARIRADGTVLEQAQWPTPQPAVPGHRLGHPLAGHRVQVRRDQRLAAARHVRRRQVHRQPRAAAVVAGHQEDVVQRQLQQSVSLRV